MATYEVSTWSDLVEKMSINENEEKIIKLVGNIDCSEEIPSGVESTINIYGAGSYHTTIDGSYTQNGVTKSYVIKNLKTNSESAVGIFRCINTSSSSNVGTWVKFKNIIFRNLVLKNGALIDSFITDTATNSALIFERCYFAGRRNRFLVNAQTSYAVSLTFTSCYFNIPYKPDDTSNTYLPINGDWYYNNNNYATANYCIFKEIYYGWTTGNFNTNPMCSSHNLGMNGCYAYGVIVGYDSIGVTKYYTYNSSVQNVCDFELRVTNGGDSGSSINVYAPKGIYRNQIKKYNDNNVTYVDSKQNINSISVSPDNMSNTEWLFSNGFMVGTLII